MDAVLGAEAAGNVLAAPAKSLLTKTERPAIWLAPSRKAAASTRQQFISRYGRSTPEAAEKRLSGRAALVAFFDFPAEHWMRLRTANPIESTQRPRAPSREQDQERRLGHHLR